MSKSIGHQHAHAFSFMHAREREGLALCDRRGMLKASMAGIGSLSLPALLQQAHAAGGSPAPKSVILLWMAGGPSHIDTWDVKPTRPSNNRGPFGVTSTRLPGVQICDRLPRSAALLDKMTLIRSVDPRQSNHSPSRVMQTGILAAAPRVNAREGYLYPGIGSVVAKHHGANHPAMPAYAAFSKTRSHIAYAGYLGQQYDPFPADRASRLPIYDLVGNDTGAMSQANLFDMPADVSVQRVRQRQDLLSQFDDVRRDIDRSGTMESMDRYGQQAVQILLGQRARQAFDLESEPAHVRDRYGKHLWCQQALLARRMVEAGVAFITIDLSYHTASGTWDTHGDNIPPYGGILRGLGPLLPLFDHLWSTLLLDLDQRGLLDQTLVIAMGEFGRTPNMGTQGSTDGRNHWPVVMSMALAGGGLRHGQVIGASEADGGHIAERPVTPGDIAATIYRHMDVPQNTTYLDPTGRPRHVVENGQPIAELF